MRIIMISVSLLFLLSTLASSTEDKIKIGVILSMTGGTAAFGQMTWNGIQIGKSMRPRALDKEVELILVDNKSDKIESANAAQRLIQKDKVVES